MSKDLSQQIENRRRILSVIFSQHADVCTAVLNKRGPLEPSEEALLSLSKRKLEHIMWKYRVSLRSLAEEFGPPSQRLSHPGDGGVR